MSQPWTTVESQLRFYNFLSSISLSKSLVVQYQCYVQDTYTLQAGFLTEINQVICVVYIYSVEENMILQFC